MSGGPFDRFFRDTGDLRHRRPSGRLWNPAADVYRTRDGWLVKLDLAGVKSDDIEITLDGALLRVSGLRRDSFCGEGISHYQLEITYSRFEKIIQFPCSIERASVEVTVDPSNCTGTDDLFEFAVELGNNNSIVIAIRNEQPTALFVRQYLARIP